MHQLSALALLDRLYELTDDSEHWPGVVNALMDVLDPVAGSSAETLNSLEEARFLSAMTPHVLRVLRQQQTRLDQSIIEDFLGAFAEQQSTALALIDRQGAIRWMSRHFSEIFNRSPSGVIYEILQNSTERPSVHSVATYDGIKKLVLIDIPQLGANFHVLLLDTQAPVELNAAQLAQLFRLTPAEIAIARMLMQGASAEQIALANNTMLSTVRGQIKKLMAKLDVSRQSELVARLHAHSARISFSPTQASAQTNPQRVHSSVNIDGCRLAYNLYGPADGVPVLFFHSWAGSRLQVARGTSYLYRMGIKLIAFDRPGSGRSVPAHGAKPIDIVKVVSALAAQLRLPRFHVLGYSLGSYYALLCAQALPEQIDKVFLVCPVAPVRSLADLKEVLPSGKLLMGLAIKAPVLARALVRLWMSHMRRNPNLYLDSVMPHLAQSDREVMQIPAVQDDYIDSFLEAIRQGDDALLSELDDMVSDWDHHRQVPQETHIWHGLQDVHVPVGGARRLAGEMPLARLDCVADAGHFLLFHHWEKILAGIQLSTHASGRSANNQPGAAGAAEALGAAGVSGTGAHTLSETPP